MTMDELVLKFKSDFAKMKSDISSVITLNQKLDNTTNKVAQSFDKTSNNVEKAGESFKKPTKNIRYLENELKRLKIKYNEHIDIFKQWGSLATENMNFKATQGMSAEDIKKGEGSAITKESLTNELERIEELEREIEKLKEIVMNGQDGNIVTKIIPKGDISKPIKDAGKDTEETTKKVFNLSRAMKSLGNTFKFIGSKGFDSLKNKFKDLSKNLTKGVDGNIKQLKKLALGLIGVRTVMSVLTKAVNAYLSFDSELQDSLNNSWNLLGSLLAPAIELVARMFAIATNYVAQFVNALTGIDLVARANAKALETQAKANQKANQAQRGLLSMDEITNLPTESTPTPASQIQMDNTIKSFKVMDDLLAHLRNGEWHLAGEDIAHGINDLLSSINWEKIQKNAYQTSYNFADFLNGLFEVDWGKIGNTLAESVNTWIELVKGFVDKFSFIQLGVGLGDALEKFITDINWEELGQTITTGFDGLFKGVLAFLETTNWSKIGESLGDFIRNIEWGKLLSDLIKILGALLKSIRDFLGSFIASFFKDLSDDTKQSVIDIMDNIWDVIDTFIQDSLSFMNDIRDALLKPFVQLAESLKLLFQGDVVGAFKKAGKAIINALISPLNIFIDGLNLVLIPFREIIVLLAKATGKKLSLKDVRIPKVPSLDVGTPNIETEGLYHLHEGEMVVPKRYNPNSNGYESSNDNKQIIDLLISLNASMLEYADRPININMNSKKVAEAIYDDSQQISKNRNQSNAVVRS